MNEEDEEFRAWYAERVRAAQEREEREAREHRVIGLCLGLAVVMWFACR